MNTDTHSVQDSTVLIEPGQKSGFAKRLEALSKKAQSFGLAPVVIGCVTEVIFERRTEQIGRSDSVLSYLKPVPDGVRVLHPVKLLRIDIQYPMVKLGNWQVVGKLEAMDKGNLQFHVTNSEEDGRAISDFASRPIACQHCKTKRRRKDGFVLRDLVGGGYKQVGASCLQDFTGIDPAAALFLARMWSVIRGEEDDLREFAGSGRRNAVSTREFLADVSYLAEKTGFLSAAKARDLGIPATFHDALALTHSLQQDNALCQDYLAKRDRHLAKADEIRKWVAEMPEASSYDRNVKLLLQDEALSIDNKHLAFAASAVALFNKAQTTVVETRVSHHVGVPGQKMTGTLTVQRAVPIDTRFGTSMLVLMHDEQGNRLTWKTSACPRNLLGLKAPLRVEASYKVKKHDHYKGVAQTTVTHLKVAEVAASA
ncbi:MAG: hypothetical protein EKK45_00285 [Curvibacter sp.]|nr:MAG: hypothetical protein EKK45_00285 [Curvibacter sp.]